MTEFDGMLEGVLRETANVAPRTGFAGRMRTGVLAEGAVAASGAAWAKDQRFEEDGMADAGVLFGSGWRQVGPGIALRPSAVRERRGFGPFGLALAVHGAALLVIGTWVAAKPRLVLHGALVAPLVEAPAVVRMAPRAVTTGGGGGQKGPTPVAQGRLPKVAEVQLAAPKAPPVEQPRIAVEPSVVMQRDLKMAENALPNLGMPNSPVVGTGSLGNGWGTGVGSGGGAGVGAGGGSNTGGGALRIGGGVSAPVPLSMPDPEFSEEARKAKVSGNVLVYLWVDALGRPTHVRVLRGIGMGLDEKAVAAVKAYRFKPARRDGQAVTVEMNVEVNFQIF